MEPSALGAISAIDLLTLTPTLHGIILLLTIIIRGLILLKLKELRHLLQSGGCRPLHGRLCLLVLLLRLVFLVLLLRLVFLALLLRLVLLHRLLFLVTVVC